MTTIKIIQSDITQLDVDAIVNAANNSLLGGGGVDGAIHRTAGPGLLTECKRLNGCPTGSAKITLAYRLPARYIIHTVGPVWQGGHQQEAELLKSCYQSCMQIAKTKQLSSLAFPAISCGIYGFPIKQAAEIAIKTVTHFAKDNPKLETVFLVCFGEQVFTTYNEVFQQLIQLMTNKNQTDEQWRNKLTPEQFNICRKKGTEPPFSGKFTDCKQDGIYVCVCCGNPLFDSDCKYNSGSGWPSFWDVLSSDSLNTTLDESHGMRRVEVTCKSCAAHLGHVFEDGPQPTGLRYCINSASLDLKDKE